MSRRGSIARFVRGVPGPALGAARLLGAASADFASVVDPRRLTGRRSAEDPFDLRDPQYIRATLPAFRALSDIYFRAEVRGMGNVPARGPVLLVGNHSGGTYVVDTIVFAQAFYDHFGADRVFHQLAHDLVFKVPGVRALAVPYGAVPASPENMRRALAPHPGGPNPGPGVGR